VQNIRAHPEVQMRVADQSFAARARVLSANADADLLRIIQDLSRSKYGWGDGTVVEFRPESPPKKSQI
jgi:hypothetical protein